jgi:hypothetical protein
VIGLGTFFQGDFPEAQMETILVFLTVVFVCFCLTTVSLVAITGKQETKSQAMQVLLSGLRILFSKASSSKQERFSELLPDSPEVESVLMAKSLRKDSHSTSVIEN